MQIHFVTTKALLDEELDLFCPEVAARAHARAEAPVALPSAAVRIADLVYASVDALAEIDPSADPVTVRAALTQWQQCRAGIDAAESELVRLLRLAGA